MSGRRFGPRQVAIEDDDVRALDAQGQHEVGLLTGLSPGLVLLDGLVRRLYGMTQLIPILSCAFAPPSGLTTME